MLSWFHRFVAWLRATSVEPNLKSLRRVVSRINDEGTKFAALTDSALQVEARNLAQRVRSENDLNRVVVPAFALAREAATRVLGLRPFDVQLLAGLAIHSGRIVEMQTGEGKTLAAVAPAFLNSLSGKRTHILTFNDYLAARDADWMGPVFRFLGCTVGSINQNSSAEARGAAYRRDITYVTAKEAGFDYLRDRLIYEPDDRVQRTLDLAIVDEADSILIDEARVPMVVAGGDEKADRELTRIAEFVRKLQPGEDYQADSHRRNAQLNDRGIDRTESHLNCGPLHSQENLYWLTIVNQALHAEVLLHRDRDYIVRNDEVQLVDEFTGRVAEGRRWPGGLQAAVEAKEGVSIRPEGTVYGSITLQHFIAEYAKRSGMTATAIAAADELYEFYDTKVVPIPPNRPSLRDDMGDIVFATQDAKIQALAAEVEAAHARRQPVLIGTATIAESENIAASFAAHGLNCQILNTKQDAEEAHVVAQAGMPGSITIATNMAGRGTDIRLGGPDQQLREQVVAAGGLYVIGTNRHESRRIDDQLRGRAGRQGDPGRSRFFISLEDDLMQRYGLKTLIPPDRWPSHTEEPIDDEVVHARIAQAQRIIEGQNFDIRRTLWRYATVLEKQRQQIQAQRACYLNQSDHSGEFQMKEELVDQIHKKFGTMGAEDLIRRVVIRQLDRHWSQHLERVREIRESIHLYGMAGHNPLDNFHRRAADAFRESCQAARAAIDAQARRLLDDDASPLQTDELSGPTSTWTYMVSDNPFGSWMERLMSRIRTALVER